ncbi:MAG TPA: hypothetical protein VFP31_01115 [Gaiellaceae bacterium]|nr:hypothetical protein [Gaiellaceae bacterium]
MARGQRDWSTVDGVTIDAYGTLLELRDPVESLPRLPATAAGIASAPAPLVEVA